MGLIKITADMTESERTAVINTNMQYLQLSNRLRKYPIGMIVSFSTDIDPNELYGGTWERIKGRVIWGIDDGETAGCTGGEKTHTLTEAEMPKHRINLDAVNADVAQSGSGYHPSWVFDKAYTVEVLSAEAGGDQPHNNMMPYYGAYTWQKTGHGIGEDPTLTEYEAFVQQMNTAISEALSKERLITNAACANALRGAASGSSVSLPDISPNEHTIGVKVNRYNLFDIASALNVNNWANYQMGYYNYHISGLKPNTKYTFSMAANGWPGVSGNGFYMSINNVQSIYSPYPLVHDNGSLAYNTKSQTITSSNNGDLYLQFYAASTARLATCFDKLIDVQLEEGNARTTYVPYVSDLTTVIVTRYGKNLFDKNNVNIITGYPDAENTINPAPTTRTVYIPCMPNTTYTVSKVVTARFAVAFTDVFPASKVAVTGRVQNNTSTSITVTSGTNSKYIVVWIYHSSYDTSITVDEVLATLQIEQGSTATEYEPYKTPTEYTPAADGTVSDVKSLYPTTTLKTNTEGVIIEAEYSRDINKAFAELQQAILSMGGNT